MNLKERLQEGNPKIQQMLVKYKWILLVIGVGLLLLLLPGGGTEKQEKVETSSETFDLDATEAKFSAALSEVEGAGKVTVVLSVKTGARQMLAQDSKYVEKDSGREESTSTVVLSKGSGTQEAITLQEIYPQFQGAVVICDGGDDPSVRLKLTEATSALTGLGADKISICNRGK